MRHSPALMKAMASKSLRSLMDRIAADVCLQQVNMSCLLHSLMYRKTHKWHWQRHDLSEKGIKVHADHLHQS